MRRSIVAIAEVTRRAGDFRVLVLERKLRLAMIVAGPAPGDGVVATRAILPEPSLMRLFLLMASAALARSLTVGLP